MNLAVVGLGYVGIIQASGLAKLGFRVKGVDIDEKKVKAINNKLPPIYEKGLKELLGSYVPSKLTATLSMKDAMDSAEITFVCVGTPSKKAGSMSLHQLKTVAKEIGLMLAEKTPYHVVVIKSTVIPGTCEKVVIPLLEKFSKKKHGEEFGVVMNPEFLREGSALHDFLNPDRLILGSSDEQALAMVKRVYHEIDCPIMQINFKEAEMIKYASNAFLATKISFINEIGNISKKYGVDTNVIAKGIGLDKRIGEKFLRSGIGFGGSCFPKDINALIYKSTELGYNPRLLRAVLDVNREQPLKLLEILEKHGPLRGKKIGVLGLTFKAGTDDIRESPAINTIKELLLEQAELFLYDPKAMGQVKKIFPHLDYRNNGQQVVDESEIVLILTEWPEFSKIDYKNKLVIDGKNVFRNGRPENYEGICW